jgi:hypothetical protein
MKNSSRFPAHDLGAADKWFVIAAEGEFKESTDVAETLPNVDAVIWLTKAILLEKSDGWAVRRRLDMSPETLPTFGDCQRAMRGPQILEEMLMDCFQASFDHNHPLKAKTVAGRHRAGVANGFRSSRWAG